MSQQSFDRFMMSVRNGTNLRLAKLNHPAYRAFFSAVVPIAAMSDVRGAFMVDGQPATVEDMRIIAPALTAGEHRAALKALRDAGLLEHDPEIAAEWVRDFDQWNPEPKRDTTNAERQARYRDRQKASRNGVTAAVTTAVSNGGITPPEVEGEVEEEPPSPQQAGGAAIFPSPPVKNRRTDVAAHEKACVNFVAEHFPDQPSGRVKHWASQLRAAGHAPTADLIRLQLEQHTGGVAA